MQKNLIEIWKELPKWQRYLVIVAILLLTFFLGHLGGYETGLEHAKVYCQAQAAGSPLIPV